MTIPNMSEENQVAKRHRLPQSSACEIRASDGRGLGLYATQKIFPGVEIISCVAKDLAHISSDIPFSMAQYLFVSPDLFNSKDSSRSYLMVCGELVFLNHNDTANCNVSWQKGNHGLLVAQLTSKNFIQKDEELTIRYTDACDYQANGYL